MERLYSADPKPTGSPAPPRDTTILPMAGDGAREAQVVRWVKHDRPCYVRLAAGRRDAGVCLH